MWISLVLSVTFFLLLIFPLHAFVDKQTLKPYGFGLFFLWFLSLVGSMGWVLVSVIGMFAP